MNLLVILAVVAAMAALWVVDRRVYQLNILAWLAAWWVALYALFSYGIEPPLPTSIVGMFMAIVTLALLAYVSAEQARLADARGRVVAFMTERRYTVPLLIVLVALPLFVAWRVYENVSAPPQPPLAGRTIHPVPPTTIAFQGTTIDVDGAENPFRTVGTPDDAVFRGHVENGRRIYYENCFYCHGDDMRGQGHFAHGFDPLPANFVDATTIAMLQESYLFWRIAKGGPGLPNESTPWASAMPAWEKFLTEDEIWDVTLFLFDYTGHKPRAKEVVDH
ncbi:MAG: cytochrome c [Rhodothermales bacterium]|nr:cytochrome c [Rhodothermales bacterium]